MQTPPKKNDLEIQRASKGAGAHRARYHSGATDVENKETQEGVEYMCKTFEEIRDESRAEGRQEEKVNNLKAMMETLNLSPQQAMNALRVPTEDRAKYAAML